MIERERLNELKKDNAVIYAVVPTFSGNYHYVKEIHLYPSMFIAHEINRDDDKLFLYDSCAEGYDDYIACIEDLFENEDDAKFETNYRRIIRREELRLHTWEEFKEQEVFTFYGKDRNNYEICLWRNVRTDEPSTITIALVDNIGSPNVFKIDASEENYIKVCKKAKELFLGGISDD